MKNFYTLFIVCAFVIPAKSVASSESAPFFVNGNGTVVSEATMELYAAAHKNQAIPVPFTTIVPNRLQPLVMDFVVILSHAEESNCAMHTVTDITRLPSKVPVEIWGIEACGKPKTYRVHLKPCNNLLNNPYVIVTRNPPDNGFLAGKDPLDAIFLVSCPDQ